MRVNTAHVSSAGSVAAGRLGSPEAAAGAAKWHPLTCTKLGLHLAISSSIVPLAMTACGTGKQERRNVRWDACTGRPAAGNEHGRKVHTANKLHNWRC